MLVPLLLFIAFVCEGIAAILGFGWFGTHTALPEIVGLVALGLASGFAATLVGAAPWNRA
jgi:hypothetical protein